MVLIYLNKKTKKKKLFTDLLIMCKVCKLNYALIEEYFKNGETEYSNKTLKITKTILERSETNVFKLK